MIEKTIDIDRMEQAVQLFGSFDENIKELEKEYGVTILSRGTDIKVSGDAEGVYNACRPSMHCFRWWKKVRSSMTSGCGM